MKINKYLILFLSIIAFFIVYLIFFNNDDESYETFAVDDTQGVESGDATGDATGVEASSGVKTGEDDSKINKYNNSFDKLRKDKPISTIFEEPLFNDVITHQNNYSTHKSGLDQCIETCNGMCVEFGQTGNAHCYPNSSGAIIKSSFHESLRDKTYKTENYDEKPDKLHFPNLR